jgi:hypothetical protein
MPTYRMADPALFLCGSTDDYLEQFLCGFRQFTKEHRVETIVVGDECKWSLAHVMETWFSRRATPLILAKSLIGKGALVINAMVQAPIRTFP